MADVNDRNTNFEKIKEEQRREVLRFLTVSRNKRLRGRDVTDALLQSIAHRLALKGRPN